MVWRYDRYLVCHGRFVRVFARFEVALGRSEWKALHGWRLCEFSDLSVVDLFQGLQMTDDFWVQPFTPLSFATIGQEEDV